MTSIKTIERNGSSFLFFHLDNRRDQATDPSLLFVHGAGGSHKVWRFQLEFLRNHSLQLIGFDLPGHGKESSPPIDSEVSIENYSANINSLLQSLDVSKAIFCGHSMGGAVALNFALEYPEKTQGLILVGTGAKLRVHQMVFEAIEQGLSNLMELYKNFAFHPETPSHTLSFVEDDLLHVVPGVLQGDFKACDRFNVMDRLKEIQIPVCIVVGNEDLMTPPKYSEYMNSEFRDSTMHIIPKAGHFIMLEQSEKLNQEILKFLLRFK